MSAIGSEALKFFTILTRIRELALDFERALWTRHDHRRVREYHWVSPAYYLNGPTYEESVESNVAEQAWITWCWQLGWCGDGWAIEASIGRDDDGGNTTLKEFSDRRANDLDELERQMEESMKELFSYDARPH